MTCVASLITLNDGTLTVEVNGHASLTGSVVQADTGTGHGTIEYADGSARRWVRFKARSWTLSFSGPSPAVDQTNPLSSIWDLDLAVDTWQATFPDPLRPGQSLIVAVVPARPSQSGLDINSANRPWSLTLREANP